MSTALDTTENPSLTARRPMPEFCSVPFRDLFLLPKINHSLWHGFTRVQLALLVNDEDKWVVYTAVIVQGPCIVTLYAYVHAVMSPPPLRFYTGIHLCRMAFPMSELGLPLQYRKKQTKGPTTTKPLKYNWRLSLYGRLADPNLHANRRTKSQRGKM